MVLKGPSRVRVVPTVHTQVRGDTYRCTPTMEVVHLPCGKYPQRLDLERLFHAQEAVVVQVLQYLDSTLSSLVTGIIEDPWVYEGNRRGGRVGRRSGRYLDAGVSGVPLSRPRRVWVRPGPEPGWRKMVGTTSRPPTSLAGDPRGSGGGPTPSTASIFTATSRGPWPSACRRGRGAGRR